MDVIFTNLDLRKIVYGSGATTFDKKKIEKGLTSLKNCVNAFILIAICFDSFSVE